MRVLINTQPNPRSAHRCRSLHTDCCCHPEGICCCLSNHPTQIVISTEAAHASVSGGVEKSASRRPQPNRPRFDPKIKFKKVENFQPLKKRVFPPRFTTHSTTFSPSKNHVQHPLFSKPPSKTPAKTQKSHAASSPGFFSKNEAKHSAQEPAPRAAVPPAL
jgi:hypothetical protein